MRGRRRALLSVSKISQLKHTSGVCLVGDYIKMIRRSAKILKCGLASLGLCMGMQAMAANSSSAQYNSITEGNVFRLKAPEPVQLPGPALPKIILKGIMTVCNRLAVMKVLFPAKPGEPAREQSYMLAEGQRDGGIEVLQVDEKAGTVKVNNSGMVMRLSFDKESAKTPGPSAALSPR